MDIKKEWCISHCKTKRVKGELGIYFDTSCRGEVISKHFMTIKLLYELIKSHKELEKVNYSKHGVEVVQAGCF